MRRYYKLIAARQLLRMESLMNAEPDTNLFPPGNEWEDILCNAKKMLDITYLTNRIVIVAAHKSFCVEPSSNRHSYKEKNHVYHSRAILGSH